MISIGEGITQIVMVTSHEYIQVTSHGEGSHDTGHMMIRGYSHRASCDGVT